MVTENVEVGMWIIGGAVTGVVGAVAFLWNAIGNSKEEIMNDVKELKNGGEKQASALWNKFAQHDKDDQVRAVDNERHFASKADVSDIKEELQKDISEVRNHMDKRFEEVIAIITNRTFGKRN